MPQDFVGLNHLESLHLSYWNCSDGQLAGVLSAVSRTLKEFKFGANNNLSLGSLALPQEERSPGKDLGIVNADQNVLRLGRLEKLSWNSKGITFDCAIELVKSCPNLKALELSRQMLVSLDDIAESLRMHCLHLESVTIVFAAKLAHFRNFSRRCSISGLRTLDITSRVPDDDLLSGILYHASTLEDLRVSRSLNGKNPRIFLPLLVECTKLKRFAINFTFLHSDTDPLEALSQKRWGCRGLEKLDLQLPFLDSRRVLTMESEQEFKRITFAAGWEMVPLSYRYFMCKTTHLPKVFELLEDQKLVRLRSLVLDDIPLRRIAHRIKQID
ncbi:hypothetical protein EC991_001058 [Linnemannia zychae]|nr:hypothetical protein EC991_001058 [Linnemannia zychae]